MAEIFKTKGLAELSKFLQQLPVKIERNVMRGAMRAAANTYKADAKANVPVSAPSRKNQREYNAYAGQLRDSVRVTTRSKRGMIYATVKAGGVVKKTNVFWAMMVEYGTRPHWNNEAKTVWHPGARAKPYMRPAFDKQSRNAVIAAGNYIKTRLATQHGIDTADIQIGEEE